MQELLACAALLAHLAAVALLFLRSVALFQRCKLSRRSVAGSLALASELSGFRDSLPHLIDALVIRLLEPLDERLRSLALASLVLQLLPQPRLGAAAGLGLGLGLGLGVGRGRGTGEQDAAQTLLQLRLLPLRLLQLELELMLLHTRGGIVVCHHESD